MGAISILFLSMCYSKKLIQEKSGKKETKRKGARDKTEKQERIADGATSWALRDDTVSFSRLQRV